MFAAASHHLVNGSNAAILKKAFLGGSVVNNAAGGARCLSSFASAVAGLKGKDFMSIDQLRYA